MPHDGLLQYDVVQYDRFQQSGAAPRRSAAPATLISEYAQHNGYQHHYIESIAMLSTVEQSDYVQHGGLHRHDAEQQDSSPAAPSPSSAVQLQATAPSSPSRCCRCRPGSLRTIRAPNRALMCMVSAFCFRGPLWWVGWDGRLDSRCLPGRFPSGPAHRTCDDGCWCVALVVRFKL